MRLEEIIKTDFLIIGSGIAGLRAAIELSRKGKDVTIITKSKLEDSNTYYAQGGISAVDPEKEALKEDAFGYFAKDTIKAGDGLCDEELVNEISKKSFDAIKFLLDSGVDFSAKDGKYILHQEGGHSKPRVFCVGDYTGKAIEEKLAEIARKENKIKILENYTAINLITHNQFFDFIPKDRCLGIYALDRESSRVKTIQANATFLATGGAGRVFQYTSNPDNATGDGIAMAYRAGAGIANMEFYQFHPTVIYDPNPENKHEKRFLLTEALRGASMGGILTLEKNSPYDFALDYNADGSHATRDIVARAIDAEMKKRGLKHVWLNVSSKVTGKSAEYIKENFPKIYEHCLRKGINITEEPIPVVPAAHYMCGGILVNKFGQTDIEGLYAIGEAACTGLMGANRLASNSLLEGALYAKIAVEHALSEQRPIEGVINIPEWNYGNVRKDIDSATLNQFWDSTRAIMTNLCGIVRNEERLKAAVHMLQGLEKAADMTYRNYYPTHEIIELRNITLVARLIAESALERKESRGTHYRTDFPHRDDKTFSKYTILKR